MSWAVTQPPQPAIASEHSRKQIMKATKKSSSTKVEDIEWAGTGENPEDWIRDDGFYALETKDAGLLGQYLREARTPDPEIVKKLADLLDPPKTNSPRL